MHEAIRGALPMLMMLRSLIVILGIFGTLKVSLKVNPNTSVGRDEKLRNTPSNIPSTPADDKKKNKDKSKPKKDDPTWGDKFLQYCKDNKWAICLSIGAIIVSAILIIYNTKQGGDGGSSDEDNSPPTAYEMIAKQRENKIAQISTMKAKGLNETIALEAISHSIGMEDFCLLTTALASLYTVHKSSDFIFSALKSVYGPGMNYQKYSELCTFRNMIVSHENTLAMASNSARSVANSDAKLINYYLAGDDRYSGIAATISETYRRGIWGVWLQAHCPLMLNDVLAADPNGFGLIVINSLMHVYSNPDVVEARRRLAEVITKALPLCKFKD